jgi:hypothetical protein
MCAIDDCERSEVWLEDQVRARKPWSCQECWRCIPPGERYTRIKSLYDGFWSTIRRCRHCTVAGEWMNEVCGGYVTEGLLEELIDHWWEGYVSVPFGRLIVGVKRKWHDGADPLPDKAAVIELANTMMRAKVSPPRMRVPADRPITTLNTGEWL